MLPSDVFSAHHCWEHQPSWNHHVLVSTTQELLSHADILHRQPDRNPSFERQRYQDTSVYFTNTLNKPEAIHSWHLQGYAVWSMAKSYTLGTDSCWLENFTISIISSKQNTEKTNNTIWFWQWYITQTVFKGALTTCPTFKGQVGHSVDAYSGPTLHSTPKMRNKKTKNHNEWMGAYC